MPVEYRSITADEFLAFMAVDARAFGMAPLPADTVFDFSRADLGRTRAAFAGGELVGTGRNFSFELTVPGGAVVPVAGVSWISVAATHRRRGILRGMMAELDADARAHDEPISILLASEGGIYGRFGYGVATWRASVSIERAYGAFHSPLDDDGRLRFFDRAEALRVFPAVYAPACATRPGMVSRPDAWWQESYDHMLPADKAVFFVGHEDGAGAIDGYIAYELFGDTQYGLHRKTLQIVDLIAYTPRVRSRLWQYALSVDLVETVRASAIPVDDPLRFLLAEPRRLRVHALLDHLFVKVLDVERALEARRYAVADGIVLEVHDGDAATRYGIDGGPDGATCRATTDEPDLVLGLSQLGSIYLGGTRVEQYVAAGLAHEVTPRAAARVDAFFASYPAPTTTTWF